MILSSAYGYCRKHLRSSLAAPLLYVSESAVKNLLVAFSLVYLMITLTLCEIGFRWVLIRLSVFNTSFYLGCVHVFYGMPIDFSAVQEWAGMCSCQIIEVYRTVRGGGEVLGEDRKDGGGKF